MANISISTSILDFLTGIHTSRSNPNDRKEEIFERAFSLAYQDMSTHTVTYKPVADIFVKGDSVRCIKNRKIIKDALKAYVKNDFLLLLNSASIITSKNQFDQWHEKTCNHIVNIAGKCDVVGLESSKVTQAESKKYDDLVCHKVNSIKTTFSCGQAQKLVNMMLKYLYIYYKCEGLTDLDQLVNYFHAPIDRFVLKEALGAETYNGTPWSQLVSYAEYIKCKNDIESQPKVTGYPSAFFWELAEWPFS